MAEDEKQICWDFTLTIDRETSVLYWITNVFARGFFTIESSFGDD